MPYIEQIHYAQEGTGLPLLFIHCPALSHVYWRPIISRLKDRFCCVALDLRGHGKSGLGTTPWTFRDIASDLSLLTRRLNLERPVLVGYSAGASIALQAALVDPGLYRGLVLISGFSECATAPLKLKIRAGLLALSLGLVRRIGPNIIASNSVGTEHVQAMLPDAQNVNPISLRCYLREGLNCHLTEDLSRIGLPSLLVYGTTDTWMHPYGRILQRGLPQAQLTFFPRTDHRVPTRVPVAFSETLADFVNTH